LHFNWVFWFMHRPPGSKITNYEGAMKKIATFGSVRHPLFACVCCCSDQKGPTKNVYGKC
jgi:hypothetical protein